MKFKLGEKVISSGCNHFHTPKTRGSIVVAQLENYQPSGRIIYTLQDVSGRNYNCFEESLSLAKTQTLYAYKDSTDEVHWSTRKYDGKERSNFGFVEAFDFNKTIDLE